MPLLRVTVLPFARAREVCGSSSIELEMPAGSTVSACLSRLRESHPGLRRLDGVLMVAVNERYAAGETPVADGDVVALIPPVSGG